MIQDFLRAIINNAAFYFSESFIFSSFWWIFVSFIFGQYFFITRIPKKRWIHLLLIILTPIILHLFIFPLLVWVVSYLFYYHTYSFSQTFNYTLSEHLSMLILLYSFPILTYSFLIKNKIAKKIITQQFSITILVAEGNKKRTITTSEILYFSASSPYIAIHLDNKKYLLSETLKSISLKLDPAQFIRVHKSTIVNVIWVDSYTTRLNGDYDLCLKNGERLRVSRNFAVDFKKLFNNTHHLTTK
ncbi:MAG: LytR/AlgR family response regulator transcription factor [Chitinophagaceae bacterium]